MLSDAEFIALYPTTRNKELAEQCGCKVATVEKRAHRLGVRKTADHLKGANNPRWKGGIGVQRDFTDERYKAWRLAVLTRDACTCQTCGTVKHHNLLQAHHVKAWASQPESRYDVANGTTLCEPCHRALHGNSRRPRNPIPCACGCGTLIAPVNAWGRARRFVHGHQARGKVVSAETRARQRAAKVGKRLSADHLAHMAEGHRGLAFSPERCARISAAKRGKPRPDIKGKPLSAEHCARISAAKRAKRLRSS